MAIWTLGSINIDQSYAVPHIPAPGETLAATGLRTGLGGKGANMAVACARAGSVSHMIAGIGPDGGWTRDRLTEYGVDTRFICDTAVPTGHAIITVAEDGENAITLFHGANHAIPDQTPAAALSQAATGDWLLMQNETRLQAETAQLARQLGLKVAYAAAPFDADEIRALAPLLDLLILNAVEMEQLHQQTGWTPGQGLTVPQVIVTMGADGAVLFSQTDDWAAREFPAVAADAVDTTGAGDTFTGYVLSGLDRGLTPAQSMRLAAHAGALMVSRHGTADVIPDLAEVQTAMGG